MIASLIASTAFLSAALTLPGSSSTTLASTSSPELSVLAQDEDPVAAYEKMRADAAEDPEALWKVYDYCDAYGLTKQGRSVLRQIVELDDEDKKAHELLGHIYYDGIWFTSERKVDEYKREEEQRMAKEKGLARFGDQWVPIEDLPMYEQGLVQLDDGSWVSLEVKEKMDLGYQQFDMGWYSPEEFKKIEEGLFPCGDQWLPIEEADKFHSELNRWWQLPWDHFTMYSTCSRETTTKALWEVERTYKDLKKIFGIEPAEKPLVILLNSELQYNAFAGGNPQAGMVPPETSGYSSFHYAFNCEAWVDVQRGVHPGAACAYWDDKAENGNRWGPLAVRHAAGMAYVEGLDPSPNSAKARVANPMDQNFNTEAFWAEKQLPKWLAFGAAAYVERYFVESGVENPLWAREWSVSMIASHGGLDDLNTIFAFPISSDNPNSSKLINEVGLLVAFVIDGKVPAVVEKHGAFKHALRNGEGVKEAAKALQDAIIAHEDKLREFAGL